jgi:hypothetical protein
VPQPNRPVIHDSAADASPKRALIREDNSADLGGAGLLWHGSRSTFSTCPATEKEMRLMVQEEIKGAPQFGNQEPVIVQK